MANDRFELASAYVVVMPSLEGVEKAFAKQMAKAAPALRKSFNQTMKQVAKQAEDQISKPISNAVTNNLGSAFDSTFRTIGKAFGATARGMGRTLTTSLATAGRTFNETLSASGKIAGGSLAAALGAVGGQMIGGGLQRSLAINEATSKLRALGHSASGVQDIMESSLKSVDMTRFALEEAMQASTQFVAAGIKPGKDLENILSNTAKLANISGDSFASISHILTKGAASGRVLWEDIVNLMDRGIPILGELSKELGISTDEVRALASGGELSFRRFNDAVNNVHFDSILFAELDIKSAFGNLRTRLNIIGADLWEPIIDGLIPVVTRIYKSLRDLTDFVGYKDAMNRIQTWLADFMNKFDNGIGKLIEKIKTKFEELGGTESIFKKIESNWNSFKNVIDGMEGPIAGLALALGSIALSNLPIIGGLFGKIGIGAGILGGGLLQAYFSSEKLQKAIEGLLDNVKELFFPTETLPLVESLTDSEGEIAGLFEKIGDGIAKVVNTISNGIANLDLSTIFSNLSGDADISKVFSSILTNINDFITTIFNNADRISAAIGGLVSAVINAFPKDISGNGLSFGAWLGESVVKAVELAASTLSAIIPVIVDIAELFVDIATSEITASVFEGLVNVAEYLSEHEGILKALVGVLAGVFVGGKLIKGFMAVKKLFGVLGGLKLGAAVAKTGGLLVGIGGMTGIIGALAAMFTAITAALKPILIGIGAVALIAAAIAGLTWIFDKIGALDQLRIFGGEIKEFALNLIDVVGAGLKVAAEALSEILAGVGKAIGYLLNPDGSGFSVNMDAWISGTQDIILALIGLGESFIEFIKEFTTGVIDNFEVILKSLADYGVDAGKGALALAGGIAAIIGATSGASWATAFGDGIESIFRRITGSESTIDRLYKMGEAFAAIDSTIVNMPTVWQQVGEDAYVTGFEIMDSFSNGMFAGISTTETLLMIRLTVMMNNLQTKLDQMPLTLTFKEPNLNGLNGYGGSVYNTTTNYDVRVNNGSALSQLFRDAR